MTEFREPNLDDSKLLIRNLNDLHPKSSFYIDHTVVIYSDSTSPRVVTEYGLSAVNEDFVAWTRSANTWEEVLAIYNQICEKGVPYDE